MNRIDRLFGILLLLQNKSHINAQQLAEAFEVSKRTIYRDIAALSELGVPIVSLPGEGYELMEGFYLPPLIFSTDEATALCLGAKMLSQRAMGKITAGAEQAVIKILVALPQDIRRRTEALTSIIEFIATGERFDLDDPDLMRLQQAIQNRQVIHLRYASYANQITEREVEPYQLYNSENAWYVEGYCHLRQDIRSFRLSRIERLTLLNQTFNRRFQAQPTAKSVIVQVRFAENILRRVRERQHYAFEAEEPLPDGEGVVMRYRLDQTSEILPWLLSWGAAAEVLSPLDLRDEIRQEAARLLQKLS